ncbi:TPA: hypothetical protein ACRUL4_003157 [Legionella pneumophila]|nr:hypothetical protein [Legionella pneumophila]HAT2115970.1 hypothetical protein [Legionella pneumophila]HAT8721280.1 hypothetical protein [Legionella pneumophila]
MEQITKEIIENVNPSTKNCLYIGQNSDEITALTKMGINVIVQADSNSKINFKSFPNRGSLAFRSDDEIYNLKQIDLFWLSYVSRDDSLRMKFNTYLGNNSAFPKHCVFSDVSHQLLSNIKADFVIACGRTNIEIDKFPEFTKQLSKEFNEHNIELIDFYVLKIATGIFMAIGKNRTLSKEKKIIRRFYPEAECTDAIKIF